MSAINSGEVYSYVYLGLSQSLVLQEVKQFNTHIDKKICLYEADDITYASVSISASTLVDKQLFYVTQA